MPDKTPLQEAAAMVIDWINNTSTTILGTLEMARDEQKETGASTAEISAEYEIPETIAGLVQTLESRNAHFPERNEKIARIMADPEAANFMVNFEKELTQLAEGINQIVAGAAENALEKAYKHSETTFAELKRTAEKMKENRETEPHGEGGGKL